MQTITYEVTEAHEGQHLPYQVVRYENQRTAYHIPKNL